MNLTEAKLKQMILQEMSNRPPHIPTTDPELERKVADLLTGTVDDINMGAGMLKLVNLTSGVKETSREKDDYNYREQRNIRKRVTEYHFKVTQSFYDAIVDQLKTKRHYDTSNWSGGIAEWKPNKDVSISIATPYNLMNSNKYRSRILRSDEPYVEHLHFKIIEVIA
tara:strand:+ start:195 stop:695 length:501 start_codon:yes stop_codon:yes gene_type:complete